VVYGLGFAVYYLGFLVYGLGFSIKESGLRVWGARVWMKGLYLEIKASGLETRV
jgi:hypothetical protein